MKNKCDFWKRFYDNWQSISCILLLIICFSLGWRIYDGPDRGTSAWFLHSGFRFVANLSFSAFFLTCKRSVRVFRLNTYLRQSMDNSHIRFNYWFVNWTKTNTTSIPNLLLPDSWHKHLIKRDLDKDSDLIAKLC